MSSERIIRGLVTAAYGRRFLVECADGITRDCVTRGKRNDFACGLSLIHISEPTRPY